MQQELLDAFQTLSNIPDEKLKTFSNSKFIVQYLKNTIMMNTKDLKELLAESDFLYFHKLFESLNENEYVILAYFDGKAIGAKKSIKA